LFGKRSFQCTIEVQLARALKRTSLFSYGGFRPLGGSLASASITAPILVLANKKLVSIFLIERIMFQAESNITNVVPVLLQLLSRLHVLCRSTTLLMKETSLSLYNKSLRAQEAAKKGMEEQQASPNLTEQDRWERRMETEEEKKKESRESRDRRQDYNWFILNTDELYQQVEGRITELGEHCGQHK